MKRILYTLILLMSCVFGSRAQGTSDLLVTMPVPPESMVNLQQRCNYIIHKYWDTFNPKSSFSSLGRLDKTMEQFFSVAPYASADTVHTSIGHLIEMVGKAKPENLLTLARIAESKVASDTSEYVSEEIYLPFVEAVATNKKVKGAEKARYAAQYRQIANSQVGSKPADFTFTRPDGSTGTLYENLAPHTLIFFYDPECTDCRLAKTRMAADMVIPALVNHKILNVVAIYPGEPDNAWREDAANLPENWVVGAWPEADTMFTMRRQPQFYYLDSDGVIKVKDIPVDNVINAFNNLIKN